MKNPWAAAVLNFFLPGIGFVYLGKAVYIIAGIVLFMASLISTVALWSLIFDPLVLVASFLLAFLWAALGYVAAEHLNKQEVPHPYCIGCGRKLRLDDRFCPSCGRRVSE